MSEMECLQRYVQTRDQAAFRVLVERYQGLVSAACRRHLTNQADIEDAMQETFTKLARHAGEIHTSLVSWLHRCALNSSVDIVRRGQARGRLERAAVTLQAPAADLQRAEVREELDAALSEMQEAERDVVLCHFYAGQTQQAMAEARRISPATMHRRIEQALETLRDRLQRRGVVVTAAALAGIVAADAAEAQVPAALAATLIEAGRTAPASSAASVASATSGKGVWALAAAAGVALTVCVGVVAVVQSGGATGGGGPAAPAAGPAAAPQAPLDPDLAGDWRSHRLYYGGDMISVTFEGDRIRATWPETFQDHASVRLIRVTRVNAGAEPRQIDGEFIEHPDPQQVGEPLRGIYQVRDGVLYFAFGEGAEPRPTRLISSDAKHMQRYRRMEEPVNGAPAGAAAAFAADPELAGRWAAFDDDGALSFQGHSVVQTDASGPRVVAEILRLDATTQPKQMDMKNAAGVASEAIYEVRNGVLRAGMYQRGDEQQSGRPDSFMGPAVLTTELVRQ